jgi:putative transposase
MARPARRVEPGVVCHVLNRGNRRMRLFFKPADYRAFVGVLCEGTARFRVELLAYCLMPNHWHLVLRPLGRGQLQAFMQWVTLTHVRRHHQHRRGRAGATAGANADAGGHLYQGRYKHFCVADDSYFLTLCRYVESNALRAKLVPRAERWPWSSLYQRLNPAAEPAPPAPGAPAASPPLSPPLGEWPVDRPGDWLKLVNRAMPPAEIERLREHVARGRPLGEPAWVKKTAAKLGLAQTLRGRGRPRKPAESLSPRQRRRRRAAEAERAGAVGGVARS